jgi:hypothetical protein
MFPIINVCIQLISKTSLEKNHQKKQKSKDLHRRVNNSLAKIIIIKNIKSLNQKNISPSPRTQSIRRANPKRKKKKKRKINK